jgi:serine protease Do
MRPNGMMPMRRLFVIIPLIAVLMLAACSGSSTAMPTLGPSTAVDPSTPTPGANVGSLAGLPDIAGVVERVAPAVVQVLATIEQTNVFGQTTDGRSQGSGVFFTNDGYLLTNNHVVEDASRVEIATFNRERVPVEVVGTDPDTDLAVLKVDPNDLEEIVSVPLGDTDAMRIGDWVIAIGSPLGFAGSVTVGVISAKGRTLLIDQNSPQLHDLVQTDAVINPGNSGGPLLNLEGEVIGINTAIIRGNIGNNQQAEGIGFAISMGTAIPVSDQLIDHGEVIRPRIGVSIINVTPAEADERGLSVDEGVLVQFVVHGGPASNAGIEVNDVIVQVDGKPVPTTSALVRLFLTDYAIGDTVTVTIVRAAVTLTFEMVLAKVEP